MDGVVVAKRPSVPIDTEIISIDGILCSKSKWGKIDVTLIFMANVNKADEVFPAYETLIIYCSPK